MIRESRELRHWRWWSVALLMLAAGCVVAFLIRQTDPRESVEPRTESARDIPASSSNATTEAIAPTLPGAQVDARSALEGRWDDLIIRAQQAVVDGAGESREFVLGLMAALDARTPAERRDAVLGFFASGRDVRFGRAFSVGPGGYLQDWPTLRVALFDYLAQRDGEAARELARELLGTRPVEAGEWTLALRELVRGQPVEQWEPFVIERVHAFVNDGDWARAGDPSWLEGFDVVVASRSADFLPDLSGVAVSAPTRSAKFAGFLAADRLVLMAPADSLAALNATPALFAGEPNVRAGLFARADVRQPAQLRELEIYFQRRDIPVQERASFAGLFPLYDLAVSRNLLTTPASRPMADMIAHDRAVLATIERWMADSRFSAVNDQLRQIRDRLREQIAQISESSTPG